jgi:eukaryotic-like serine/threonine-protein kinase
MTQVFPGQILAGKYRVDRVLGAGGMGVVVAATHLQLEERVAIKFLLPEALQNAEAVARFGREARAAVKIRGEHVARVIDVGALETGAPFMVMEYLDGHDLSELIRDRGVMPPVDAVDAVLQACEALAEAHALGIVHRDLKPANLFMIRRPDGTPSVKVLDFGISKLTNATASDHALTGTTAVMGSPLYMSPEQMTASRDVDARADIWAIGVVLYELLSGRVPFSAETLPQICALILTVAPPTIRQFVPSVPVALQAVVLRCLEKDRSSRFQNIGELARALAPFGSRATSRSVERIGKILGAPSVSEGMPASMPSAQAARHEPSTQSNWGQTRPSASSAGPLIASAAAAIVVLGSVAGFFIWRSKPSATQPLASAAPTQAPATFPGSSAAPATPPPATSAASAALAPSAEPARVPSPKLVLAPHASPAKPAAAVKSAAAVPVAPVAPPVTPPAPKTKRSADDLLSGRN